jgi:hypothetical protein
MFAADKTAAASSGAVNYIEDVFQTWLYTGTGAAQTITNNIDLSTKGGLTWIKSRSAATNNNLFDTAQGTTKLLHSNTTAATVTDANSLTAFNTTGFTLGSGNTTGNQVNTSAATYVSWTFRKQPKFFDVVTYTGTGNPSNEISHNLGSAPGCIIIKNTSATSGWPIAISNGVVLQYLYLNTTQSSTAADVIANGNGYVYEATSTIFNVFASDNASVSDVNTSGQTYVAYLFASNAGGFGLTGTDNVITCGAYTGNGSATGPVVTLGYEPQWLMVKKLSNTGNWQIIDNMRGMPVGSADATLQANLSNAESSVEYVSPTATGFQITSTNTEVNTSGAVYIYMAIRRGPMKVPTDATKVFNNNLETSATNPQTLTTGFPVDLNISTLNNTTVGRYFVDRLRGTNTSGYQYLLSNATSAEGSATGGGLGLDNNTGMVDSGFWNTSGAIYWSFRRAPSFFDEVCYTGTGTSTAFNHNLTVVPEMIITKIRNSAFPNWGVWHNALSPSSAMLFLNTTGTQGNGYVDTVTSTTFSFATANGVVNSSSNTYVAYLFATCAGVSKVGSYTGNGTTQTINCGFTGGARFVLIKRTDSTGDWYVYDTARGMTTLTDPYLLLNSTAAESATLGSVTTVSTGFAVNASILAAINTNAASYIFLAIA